MYVHVEIDIDEEHLLKTIMSNFFEDEDNKDEEGDEPVRERKVYLLGTVQFTQTLEKVARMIGPEKCAWPIPREKPLSAGEVLGCTAPKLPPLTKEER